MEVQEVKAGEVLLFPQCWSKSGRPMDQEHSGFLVKIDYEAHGGIGEAIFHQDWEKGYRFPSSADAQAFVLKESPVRSGHVPLMSFVWIVVPVEYIIESIKRHSGAAVN